MDSAGKADLVRVCRSCLEAVPRFFALEAAMGELQKISSTTIPNYVQFDEDARQADVEFTTDVVAVATAVYLTHWDDWGPDPLSAAGYLEFGALNDEPAKVELLKQWLAACESLADYALAATESEERSDRDAASRAFRELAVTLIPRDLSLGLEFAANACSLATSGELTAQAAATLAKSAEGIDEETVRMSLAFRVLGMSRLWAEAGVQRPTAIDLFDAFDQACRFAPLGSNRANAARLLEIALESTDVLSPQRFLWLCAFHPDRLDSEVADASVYASTTVTGADELVQLVSIGRVISELEDRRLRLAPAETAAVAIADLNNWSIDHRGFRRAVPISTSILREANRSDILLTLSHEIVHIRSAQGWLGAALNALRFAATSCEIELISRTRQFDEPPDLSLATLPAPDPVLLGLVEKQLELVRKAQLLRAIWLPWLEGIAVVGELAADPKLEPDISTAFSDVVSSLIDRIPTEVAEQEGLSFEAASRRIRSEAEDLYADALTDSGAARLRTYLDGGPERYLAGYLAARAVLTDWRRRHRFNGLTGYQALIGATTVGTRSAVPSLALAPDRFEGEARAAMLSWLARAATLDADSLDVIDGKMGWQWTSDGQHDHVEVATATSTLTVAAMFDAIIDLARTAYASNRDAPIDRAATDPLSEPEQVADYVAEHLPPANDELLAIIAESFYEYTSIVPIASVSAPFWITLIKGVPRAMIAIRVTETSQDGGPSYTMFGFPLTADEHQQLTDEMKVQRSGRIELRRYADIAESTPENVEAGRGLGRNVLGLRYGALAIVRPAGQLMGQQVSPSLEKSVRQRLLPEDLLKLDTWIVSGQAIALRALRWLDPATIDDELGAGINLGPWIQRVRALADVVQRDDDGQLVKEMSARILAGLGWTDEQFDAVCESGLRALFDNDSPTLAPLLAAIMTSGFGVDEVVGDDVPDDVKNLLFEPTGHGYDLRAMTEH